MSAIAVAESVERLLKPGAKEPEIVEVPAFNFLMVDGTGNPNTAGEFQEAIGALYPLAYGAKFALKKSGLEVRVMPLEALFWSPGSAVLKTEDHEKWRWTLMLMQPEGVTAELIEKVRAPAMRKRPNPALPKVRFEAFREGTCAQVMHIGPYSAEKPTIEKLHAFIAERGWKLAGKHHEIYLGDPRRAAPEKLRTIVRQPIARR